MGKGALMFFLFPEFLQVNKKNLCLKVLHLLSFFFKGHSNTVCEMRVAWVWLLQKASACYCLPSQLLQAPAPWLPYMRDQGLPRCFWERRAQCERGQTSPQNTHFLCMLGALVGIQPGSLTQFFFFPSLFLMKTVACLFTAFSLLSAALYSMWLDNTVSLSKRKFVQTLFIRCQTEAPHVEKVKVVLSTSHSCQKSSATEPQH